MLYVKPPDSQGDLNGARLSNSLCRIECLLDKFSLSATSIRRADALRTPEGATNHRLSLTATRLRILIEEINRQPLASDWNGMDAIVAWWLLDELSTALRDCRVLAQMAEEQLHRTSEAIKDIHQLMNEQLTHCA